MELLIRWNRTINLISKNDEGGIWDRHIQDSLALLPLLPPEFDSAVDLGSGGGLPGLVLAIVTGSKFILVEADQRKAAFLQEASRATRANSLIDTSRIETLKFANIPVVLARALAPLDQLLDWTEPLLAQDGICIFPKGKTATEELTHARARWQMRVEQFPSPTNQAATILRISEISRVRCAFPH